MDGDGGAEGVLPAGRVKAVFCTHSGACANRIAAGFVAPPATSTQYTLTRPAATLSRRERDFDRISPATSHQRPALSSAAYSHPGQAALYSGAWRTIVQVPRSLDPAVADKFDPYREALVMEVNTIWPAEYRDLAPAQRAAIEAKLHANPAACAELEYVRTHTGFCRQITVTPADVDRVGA
jgi:hypothetical protein